MRFGFSLQYVHREPEGKGKDPSNSFDETVKAAQAAEQVGFDTLWYPDHFMFGEPNGPFEVDVLEAFTTLAALATQTERIKLGPYVAGAPYRNAALMAKMFTTLDVISHGRVIIGLGAAWHEPEFHAYGWDFPPVAARMAMLEDTIRIIEAMLKGSPASYQGAERSIDGALNFPRPAQRPRPPLMIGGGGEKRTLRIVAKYADIYNIWGGSPQDVAHKYAVLRRHCEDVGRSYEEIERTNHVTVLLARDEDELAAKRQRFTDFASQPPVIGTPDAVIARLREYADAGSQSIILDLVDWADVETIHLFAERVMPALA